MHLRHWVVLESGGALAMIVGGNLGIMMIEGLIVYIQSLRFICMNSLQSGMMVVHSRSDKLARVNLQSIKNKKRK